MSGTLSRYIAKRILGGIIVAFAIIIGIIMLVDFVETSRNIGGNPDVSLMTILGLTVLNAPHLVEQTIPFVVLFGVMGALYSMNRHAELTVMRASGLSAWRFLRPAALVTLVLGIIWAAAFNPMAAILAQKHADMKAEVDGPSIVLDDTAPIWLREGNDSRQIVIHAMSSNLQDRALYDVTFYDFDIAANNRPVFSARYDAKKAKLENGYWALSQVTENEDGKPPRTYDSISKTTDIDVEMLRSRTQTKNRTPFWQLRSEIRRAKQAGLDATPLLMQFHKLLSLPLTLVAMAIIAAGTSLNMAREGGTFRLMVMGAGLGFIMFFADSIIGAFGTSGVLPPALAAWSVPVFVLCCGLIALSRTEDG